MTSRIREALSVQIAKRPRRMLLCSILLFNVLFIFLSAFIISRFSLSGTERMGFFEAAFCTVTMILDAGCVQFVISDIGQSSVVIAVLCLIIIIVGMITFTGAVIGYVTNYISSFIERANSGARPLSASGHTVILNWNTRASEIVNEFLYSGKRETIVILVDSGADDVRRELDDRLAATMKSENAAVRAASEGMGPAQGRIYRRANTLKNRLSIIIREGSIYSTKQLCDISIAQARTVILLDPGKRPDEGVGSAGTIKGLIQIAELTGAEDSADDQIIIVEVEDDWTLGHVNKLIRQKERLGKCNIIPVDVSRVLGDILSQFSIMPELNIVYSELFSNKGAEFFCRPQPVASDETAAVSAYLETHYSAVPMTAMETKTGPYAVYMAGSDDDIDRCRTAGQAGISVSIRENFWLERRNVAIVGHNSKIKDIMDGFDSFRNEWRQNGEEIMNVIIIDDKKSLEKQDYYRGYSYVNNVFEAETHETEAISAALNDFVDQNENDVSILILSDDTVPSDETDAAALTYLVYVQDIIFTRAAADPDFDLGRIDVVVEILDPKNYDVVRNYSVDNVVISNRYVSKMISQMGRKEALHEFYQDILTYDGENAEKYESKELYVKKVGRFFDELPPRCTAAQLIRAVYEASPADNKAIVIGYFTAKGGMTLFSGDQNSYELELTGRDKLIIFSNH